MPGSLRNFRSEFHISNSKQPVDFCKRASLDLEIGCGVGFHPIQYAKQNPGRSLIAIEKTSEKFFKFQRRFENSGCPSNLLPVHGHAITWIVQNVCEKSIENIFILYPNPYPKTSQRNLRWHRAPFMAFLLTRLIPGGRLHLATNESFYHEEAKNFYQDSLGLELREEARVSAGAVGRTHFETKYLRNGQKCWNMEFEMPDRIMRAQKDSNLRPSD